MGLDWEDLDPTSDEFLGGAGQVAFPVFAVANRAVDYARDLFGGRDRPGDANPQGLPGLPQLTDEITLLRGLQRKQQLAAMKGRASTFLTGPRGTGLGLPSSDIAQAFIRAALDDREYEIAAAPEVVRPPPPPPEPPVETYTETYPATDLPMNTGGG